MLKTILYSLGFISLGLISGSLGPTIPALAAQTHSQMHEISSLFLVRSLGTMVGAVFIGRLYDRFSGHPLLGASLLASALALALTPLTNLLWLLLAISAVVGLAGGSIVVGASALIVQVHGERSRPFMSALHFAFGLGGFLAPILFTRFLGRENGLQLTFWTLAALTVPAALLVLLTPSPRLQPHEHISMAIRPPLATLSFFVIFFFLEVGAEAILMGWYFSYVRDRGVPELVAGWMNSGFWAAFTLGRLATIWLSVRFKAISMIVAQTCFAITIAVVMLIFPASHFLLWTGAIGFGLALAPIFSSTFAYAQRMMGLSGKVTGFFLIGSSSGAMFWPWLVGQFLKSRGPQVVIITVLVDLIGALITILALHETNSQSVADRAAVSEAIGEGQTELL